MAMLYLFVAEILALKLREYNNIPGIKKICYDNPGNVPNKGQHFNTQTFRKMYLFVIFMISRRWFQTK